MRDIPGTAAWTASLEALRRALVTVDEPLTLPGALVLVCQYRKPRGRVIALARIIGANRNTDGFSIWVARWGRSYRRTRSGPNIVLPTLWALDAPEDTSGQRAAHHGSPEPMTDTRQTAGDGPYEEQV
jgi:hypothetical protein